jgi:hypothetical protein
MGPQGDNQELIAEAEALLVQAVDLIAAAEGLIDRAEWLLLTETDGRLPPDGGLPS